MKAIRRWAVHEYGKPEPMVHPMAVASGFSDSKVRELIFAAGERAAGFLNLTSNPITVDATGVRATDIAGIVRIAPGIELEIIPKFLPVEDSAGTWREDFFFLANLSKHGRLLLSEKLAAGRTSARDIPSLVGHTIVAEYLINRRRPLRSYRRRDSLDFAIDGDVEPESIALPDPEGFHQQQIVYDQLNPFNGAIAAASRRIANEVRDPALQAQLLRISQSLGEQHRVVDLRNRRVPSRARRWQPLFDLAHDVLRGFGISYEALPSSMPGFVVNTWRVWEDIVTLAISLACGKDAHAQGSAQLGIRKRLPNQGSTAITVTPDLTLPDLLVDAKYKTRVERGPPRVSEADLYESLAFARATGLNRVLLIYPALPVTSELGLATAFEVISVDDVRVVGLHASVMGVSKRGMLRVFAERLAASVVEAAALEPRP